MPTLLGSTRVLAAAEPPSRMVLLLVNDSALSLDATDDDALDEVPLRDEEEQKDRNEHGQ